MTENEIRIAIAKECGWELKEVFETSFGDPNKNVSRGMKWHDPNGIQRNHPDYQNDLNACADFEITLTKDEAEKYRDILEKFCLETFLSGLSKSPFSVFAAADQRCTAFLQVKGVWKE